MQLKYPPASWLRKDSDSVVNDVHCSAVLLSFSSVSMQKKNCCILDPQSVENMKVRKKEEKLQQQQGFHNLPCIVSADFAFSSVLSDSFCFCGRNAFVLTVVKFKS